MTNLEELIKKSKRIELRAKGVIDDNLNGEYSTISVAEELIFMI